MAAKPIIDIDVELAPGVEIDTPTTILTALGYEYEGDKGIPDRFAYRQTSLAVPLSKDRTIGMDHHLYVCPQQSAALADMLRFRDKLRNSVELRNEYMQIKQIALQHANGVRQIYVDEKARIGDSFFKRVIDKQEGG
jgi:GrpB-like predicted nucleotidyltransferase (UPF0157 family)